MPTLRPHAALLLLLAAAAAPPPARAQEPIDHAMLARIRAEGLERSQVGELFNTLTNVIGPRLSGSPAFLRSAEWWRAPPAAGGGGGARAPPAPPRQPQWTIATASSVTSASGRQSATSTSNPSSWSEVTCASTLARGAPGSAKPLCSGGAIATASAPASLGRPR
jgi:hypothetical protein